MDRQARITIVGAVERIVGYHFSIPEIVVESLTHTSYANELNEPSQTFSAHNERLEFLGDAVVGLVVARLLMDLFPNASEGRLSRWRSSLVSRKTLAQIGNTLKLGDLMLLGKGEQTTGGSEKRSILAGAVEALVGAIFLDAGLDKVTEFLQRAYEPLFANLADGDEKQFKLMDKKTHLQERTQSVFKMTPVYRVVESWGPEHEKIFRVEIALGKKIVAWGDGPSKKEAEQEAAGQALEALEL